MRVFRIENEQGLWLTDMALSVHSWKPGDCIYQGSERIEVLAVREGAPALAERPSRPAPAPGIRSAWLGERPGRPRFTA